MFGDGFECRVPQLCVVKRVQMRYAAELESTEFQVKRHELGSVQVL
jgi:hypothetical protein